MRIALFGDSFTHGDDVPYGQTWGAQLETMLDESGIEAEVVNFGVSAYGMDQAYLRWQTLGKQYRPDVVLFGFQAENVNRNVNLLRAFYAGHTGIPFSKPRFILPERSDAGGSPSARPQPPGRLQVINRPTLALQEIPGVMANMDAWKLSKHEAFYDAERYRRRWWHASRLVSLAVVAFSEDIQPRPVRLRDPYRLDGEPARVTLALLRRFRRDAGQQDARFFVVHLPKQSDLQRLLQGRGCAYQPLLERIDEEHTLIDPQPPLLQAARAESVEAIVPRHYSAEGNRMIAEVVARGLSEGLERQRRGMRKAPKGGR